MGIISTGKLLLFVGGALLLVADMAGPRAFHAHRAPHSTSAAILLALAGLGLSIFWSTAPMDEASHAWLKHAKLAMIPLLIALLRTRAEALAALACFLAVQGFVLAVSWLQVFQVPIPFPTQSTPGRDALVFAGHLDQPIMTSLAAAVFWHLREDLGLHGRRGLYIASAVVAAAMASVLLVQFGRTGHLVAIAMVCAAVFWSIPRRFKLAAALSPLVVAGAIAAGSSQVQHRMAVVWQESTSYAESGDIESSSGERLNYWRRSLQAFAERPVLGFGVGSWNMEYNRLEGGKGRLHTWQIRNPHEEFLLWMVEAGLLGLLLVVGVFGSAIRDSLRMASEPAQRAALSVVLAMLVSCAINASLYDAQIGDYLCVALALALAYGLRTGPTPPAAGTAPRT